jgi:uncharacterized protein
MIGPVDDIVGFGRVLRSAGLAVGIDQLEAWACALPLIEITERRSLYLAARATLLTRHEDLAVFDAEFARWFDGRTPPPQGQKTPHAPRHDRGFVKTALGAYMAERAGAQDPEVPLPEEAKAASELEQLGRKDFAACTEAEREAIMRALRALELEVVKRRSARRIADRHGGELDLRAAVRSAARHGGRVLELSHRSRKWKRRPLVVLADVSGSMELYSRLVLQFLHTLSAQHPTEVFAFGTRLTRITPQLALRDLDEALDRASAEVVDFGGGTRIGACLHAFDRRYARRVLRRGAIVLVISDGLDTGEPAALAREVARLQRRTHRLVWLNPLLGDAAYRPLAEGMAAALPHVDDFLPVRDLRSLEALARHVAAIPRRRKNHNRGVAR